MLEILEAVLSCKVEGFGAIAKGEGQGSVAGYPLHKIAWGLAGFHNTNLTKNPELAKLQMLGVMENRALIPERFSIAPNCASLMAPTWMTACDILFAHNPPKSLLYKM